MGPNALKLLYLCFLTGFSMSLNAQSKLFELIDAESAGISFSNIVTETESQNILTKGMPYLYAGGGVGIIDFNNDGLQDIFLVGNQVNSKLYQNNGNLKFSDVTDLMGIKTTSWCTGVLIADVNNDGWQDIYILKAQNNDASTGGNLLYINQKGKSFSEQAKKYQINLNGRFLTGSFFDMNGDGDLDLYLARYPDNSTQGNDVNFDFYKRYQPGFGTDYLFENDRNKVFKDISAKAGIIPENGFGISVLTADFNDDALPDIYVGNDFAERDFLYINQGNSTFKESLIQYFSHTSFFTMGLDYQDLNNDLLPDLISLDMNPRDLVKYKQDFSSFDFEIYKATQANYYYQEIRNCVQFKNPDQSYSEIGQVDKLAFTDWSWSPLAADFDLDGDKDIFITNGLKKDILNQNIYMYELDSILKARGIGYEKVTKMEMLSYVKPLILNNYFFSNKGDKRFEDVSDQWVNETPGVSTGAATVDLDNDGDLDIVTNNIDAPPFIYINHSVDLNSKVFIGFKAKTWLSNGIKVYLYGTKQDRYQEIFSSRGFQSCSDPSVIFGLEKGELVDSVAIHKGNFRYVSGPLVTGKYYFVEDLMVNATSLPKTKTEAIEVLDTLYLQSNISPVNDFKIQPLLLKRIIPQHPTVKQLDIDRDGDLDLYKGKYFNDPAVVLINESGVWRRYELTNYLKDDSLVYDTDIIPITGKEANGFLVSSMHVNDSLHHGINALFWNKDHATPVVPNYTLTSLSGFGKITKGAKEYFLCFGATTILNYPFSYSSGVLIQENSDVIEMNKTLSDQLNLIIGKKQVNSVLSLDNRIIYTGNFNTINEITIDDKGNLENKVLYSKKGFYDNISSNMDGSFISVGNLGNNWRFNLQLEDSLGLMAFDIDKNQGRDLFYTVSMLGNNYPIYGYKDLVSQFPKCKRNVNDILTYKTADVDRVFDRHFTSSDFNFISTLDNVWLKNGVVTSASIQFTCINSFIETDDYYIFGGNDQSFRPDLGGIVAGAIIVMSKKSPSRYKVYNKPFRQIFEIFPTVNSDEFLVQDGTGLYRIKIP